MIEKLKTINPYDETEIDMEANSVAGLVYENTLLVQKLNELVDAVNELQATISKMENVAENGNFAKNAQPDYVTTSYMTDGNTREYYGQNGASIVTEHPLPAGYVITIKEPETKGGDNE